MERVRRVENDGRWWERPVWEHDGSPSPPDLQLILPVLRDVFPADWFLRSRGHPMQSHFVTGGLVPVSRLTALGKDLCIVHGNSRFDTLRDRLRAKEGFHGAEHELSVLARILSRDPTAEPYPELSGGKRAEARIRRKGRALLVEAKTLTPPSNDKRFARLSNRFFAIIGRLGLESQYRVEWELTQHGEELALNNGSRLEREWDHAVEQLVARIEATELGERGELAGGGLLRVRYYPKIEARFNLSPGFPLQESVALAHLFRRLVGPVRKQLITEEPTLLCVRQIGIWPPLTKAGLEKRMGNGPPTPTYLLVDDPSRSPVLARHPEVEPPDRDGDLLAIALPLCTL